MRNSLKAVLFGAFSVMFSVFMLKHISMAI